MKKLICVLLLAGSLLTALSLSACGNNHSGDADTTTENTKNNASTEKGDTNGTPSDNGGAVASLSLQEIADGIKSAETEYPMLMSVEVEDDAFEYYFGIAKPAGVAEALAVEPAMTSVPFSVCLLRVEEGADTAKLAGDIKKSVDPAKWVCVTASYVETAVNGDVVLLVMDGDDARGKALIDAFKAL